MQTTILMVLIALGMAQFVYLVWSNPIGFIVWFVLWIAWFGVRFFWFYFMEVPDDDNSDHD